MMKWQFAVGITLFALSVTAQAATRVTVDQVDDYSGDQLHAMYVLPIELRETVHLGRALLTHDAARVA